MRLTKHHPFFSALLVLITAGLLTSGQAIAQQTQTNSAPRLPLVASALRISAGDLLDLQVFDTPELSAKLRVSDKGEVVVPVVGSVRVDGLTADEAGTRVEQSLRQAQVLKDPHVSVFVVEYATQGVSVLGEVKNPGVYPVLGRHGLLDVISAAGGVTATAGKAVSVTHKGDPQQPVVVQLGNGLDVTAQANVGILPGDIIVVSRSGIVYVVGDLLKPGGFLIENNDRLTVLQALALAQGTNKTAALNRSKLIRKSPDGRQ
ncbi:MAG: polysaccharide biosynthesis/export family protein, partial [Candidatus Korobacteraceae bacterium]